MKSYITTINIAEMFLLSQNLIYKTANLIA